MTKVKTNLVFIVFSSLDSKFAITSEKTKYNREITIVFFIYCQTKFENEILIW